MTHTVFWSNPQATNSKLQKKVKYGTGWGLLERSQNKSLVWEEKTETWPGLEHRHCRVTIVNFATVTATSHHLLHETGLSECIRPSCSPSQRPVRV